MSSRALTAVRPKVPSSSLPRSRRRRLIGSAVSVSCLCAAGCGGAWRPPQPVAARVCDGAQRAAVTTLGHPVSARIAGRDPANLRCSLRGSRLAVAIISQASPQAYAEFNTTTAHQSQVYGPGVHEQDELPVRVALPGAVVAVWIPAQREIVATDAMPNHRGAYVTVTVSGAAARGRQALVLARAVARAIFAAHPHAR